jgi:aryl-alcohol dehydrogenase-like predicted oxidoreductase
MTRRRRLGRTGLEVTTLGYGAMELSGDHAGGGRQVEQLLNAVLDAGVNFLDTANDYGASEECIGRFVGHRRQEFYLATKCGCPVARDGQDAPPGHVWTRENLLQNIETSLRRMKTDYVDVWQLHNPSVEQATAGDLVRAMEDVRAAGKARWIGVSSTLPHITEFITWGAFDTFQLPYSGLERAHEDVITAAAQAGGGTIIRGGVARGAPNFRRRLRLRLGLHGADPWAIWARAGLDEFRAPGESRTAFLLRFTLSHPGVHTTIVGTSKPEHLRENVRSVERGPLPADMYAEVKRRLEGAGQAPARGRSPASR